MNNFRSALDKGDGLHPSGPLMPGKKQSGASKAKRLSSVQVPRETSHEVNHRDDDRHRLQSQHATLKAGRKNHRVELINVSGGGAMIRTDAALAMWQKVHLGLGDCLPVECAVRWIRGDRIGLEFAHETQVMGDSGTRNAMLLGALERSFPETADALAVVQPDPAPVKPSGTQASERHRVPLRHRLIWWGEIHHNHDSTRVRLRNISAEGALVDSDVAFASDAEVLLDLGAAGHHFATVIWSRGDQVGLRFQSPFDIALLAQLKPEVASHAWLPPAYLKGGRRPADDPASGWQSSSLSELRRDLEGFLKR